MRKFWKRFYHELVIRAEDSENHYVALGFLGFVGFPFYFFVWHHLFPQPYESLTLRIVGSLLCLSIMLKDVWPDSWRRYMPITWYIVLLYSLPFFFTFMLLKNNGSMIWVTSSLASLFILILIVDWISLAILFVLGTSLATTLFLLTTPAPAISIDNWPYMFVFLFVLVIGGLFSHKKHVRQQEKLEAMASICSTIAHEIRTPLLGIRAGLTGIKRYTPVLFEGYNLAKDNNLPVKRIRKAHYENLMPAMERLDNELNYANTIIDMLLMNVGRQRVSTTNFGQHSMQECIDVSIERYPFNSLEEKNKINIDKGIDFDFHGSELLMVHVLFNLIKNALHFLMETGDGDIYIWLERGKKKNHLYFKDTGPGISEELVPRLFERFFTTTLTGTGIGLTFSKMALESFGASIRCESTKGEHTTFIITVPRDTPSHHS